MVLGCGHRGEWIRMGGVFGGNGLIVHGRVSHFSFSCASQLCSNDFVI